MGERCGSDHFFYLYFAGETQSREGPELSGNVSHFQPLAIRAHWYKTSLGHISNSDSCFPEVMLVFSTTHLILTTLAIFTSCSLVEVTAKLTAPDQEQAMTWAWQFPVTIGNEGRKSTDSNKTDYTWSQSLIFSLPTGSTLEKKTVLHLILWARVHRNLVPEKEDTLDDISGHEKT